VPEHPNVARIRQLFAAFGAADVDLIWTMIPEDAVWHFPGRRGRMAGQHRGREEIFAFLMKVQELTEGTFHLDLIDVTANDQLGVAFFRGHGTRNGKVLDNPTCLRMRFENGQVKELWEFVWDLYDVDDFWS
jgi:ketosteroid isomerase-like protein